LSNFSATISVVIAFMGWKIAPLNSLFVITITKVYSLISGKFIMQSIEIFDQGLSGMGNGFNRPRRFSFYFAIILHVS
jgi:hypothetical protein